MSTLIIVLLTILIAINIFIISIVALNTMKFKDRSSRTGGMVLLVVLVADVLSMIGGAAL
ncbi:hypothetical protein AALB81_18730 [Lachnospiraceae bacterium 48-33]